MITGEIKSQVDRVWDAFWSGGISNPLSVIEQITYLLFARRLDELHTAREKKANLLDKPIADPIFNKKQNKLRWSRFKDLEPEAMFERFRDEVFPFIQNLGSKRDDDDDNTESAFSRFMKDANFIVPGPALLAKVVDMLDKIPMEDRDTKGDLYEYMLGKIATAGTNGQFRTPRHIIRLMVDMLAPTPEDIVGDPACGTCGFLIGVSEHLQEHHPKLFHNKKHKAHFNRGMFHGDDFDATMLRIGAMNLMLHGIEYPHIMADDSLAEDAADARERYTMVLANPPFAGSLDYDEVAKDLLQTVKTKKTELLFLSLFLAQLKIGGRCACIVPDGVLFGSSKAHKTLRKLLIEEQRLDAIVSMPSGVFKPYAGVSTAILLFTKTNSGGTDDVWFYDMLADGFSLDDKRTPQPEKSDLDDVLKRWQHREKEKKRKRTEQSFLVPKSEIASNDYDLSINRYKEVVYEAVEYDPPKVILERLAKIEQEIAQGRKELEGMLG